MLRLRLGRDLFIISAVFFCQWFLLFNLAGPTWDAVSYYIYARSVVFDHDLALQNDFSASYATASPDFEAKALHTHLTEEGRAVNEFAIGSSVFWLPWLALLRFLATIGVAVGILGEMGNGFEWLYTGSMSAFSALAVLASFLAIYKITQRLAGKRIALVATLTLMFTAPLLYYQFREPMYSHAISALATTLVVYVWLRQWQAPPRLRQAILLGGLIGLAGLVRWQNVMYLALPIVSTAYAWLALPKLEKQRQWWESVLYLAAVGASAIAIFSIQMAVWRVIFGSWVTIPQGNNFIDWRAPFIKQVLFSTFHGLLAWLPLFFFAVIGLLSQVKKKAGLVLPLLVLLMLEVYVNGSTRDWFGAGGFGARRFTSELAILTLGYTFFLQLWPQKIRAAAILISSSGLVIYNWLLLRFAQPEKLGGHVVSMLPDFRWADESYATFLSALGSRLFNVFSHPFDFFVLPGSPAHKLLILHQFPTKSLLVLLLSGLFLFALWSGRHLPKKIGLSGTRLAGLAAALLIAVDIWIVFGA